MSKVEGELRQELMQWVLESAARDSSAGPLRREAAEAVVQAVKQALHDDLASLSGRLDQIDQTLTKLEVAITGLGNIPQNFATIREDQSNLGRGIASNQEYTRQVVADLSARISEVEVAHGLQPSPPPAPPSPMPAQVSGSEGRWSWLLKGITKPQVISKPQPARRRTSLAAWIIIGVVVLLMAIVVWVALTNSKKIDAGNEADTTPPAGADPARQAPPWQAKGSSALVESGWNTLKPTPLADGTTPLITVVCKAAGPCPVESVLALAPGSAQDSVLQAAVLKVNDNAGCGADFKVDGRIGPRSLAEFQKVVTCAATGDEACLNSDPCQPLLPAGEADQGPWRGDLLRWALWKLGKASQ